MRICGFNKSTLLDYPGKVAAGLFLGGCNFRCPFCQNGGLVLHSADQPDIPVEEVLSVLKKRQGILDGVCVSGGEPTCSPDLAAFLEKIKELGYPVKLDTNGSHPDMVKSLYEKGLIDKVAMDIKAAPEHYGTVAGLSGDARPVVEAVRETAAFLMESGIEYEFRTTVVKELHTEEDFVRIGEWLSGAKTYFLQVYRDSAEVIKRGFSPCSEKEMQAYARILEKTIQNVEIRGMD